MKGKSPHDAEFLLKEEASAFDQQILERIENGYIPDLKRYSRNEWFQNNPWRDSFYADMVFGTIVRQISEAKEKYLAETNVRILEVACGPGHICLELARIGYEVHGIDISPQSIKFARQFSETDPFNKGRGPLTYQCSSLFDFQTENSYDIVVFANALHHFGDIERVLRKTEILLKENGLFYASEPVREGFSDADATVVHLIRALLSRAGIYYEPVPVPDSKDEFNQMLKTIKDEFYCRTEKGDKVQSPLDNEAVFSDMYPVMKSIFEELEMRMDFSFFDRIVGGLRCRNREEDHKMAEWLYNVDRLLCAMGKTTAEQFHFIGRKK
jgi:2-polyprenyl-3-methyl-5-hydroxy-6-metoxy-1,4-benzoquinol methylase